MNINGTQILQWLFCRIGVDFRRYVFSPFPRGVQIFPILRLVLSLANRNS